MVSSSVASDSKTLSYADRAKKAQKNKPQMQSSSPLPVSPNNHSGPGVNAVHTAADVSSSAVTTNSRGSKVSSPSEELTSNSSVVFTRPQSSPSSPSTSTAEQTAVQPGAHSRVADAESRGMSSEKPTSKSAPVVNVWDVRREQMARAQSLAQSGEPSSSSRSSNGIPSSSASQNLALESRPASASRASSSDALSNSDSNAAQQKPPPPVSNGANHTDLSNDDDPFVVRPGRQPFQPPLPSALPPSVDEESWPEVGKSIAQLAPAHAKPELEKKDVVEGSSVVQSPRKSEKTKWVPIPAAELQAAADASRPSHHRPYQSHARNHSQFGNNKPKNIQNQASASASGSISASVSQGQSRAHSTRGSAPQSVSHSQAQSVAGSVHSSPRPNGRGRRLPDEVTGSSGYGAEAVNSARRSRANSPNRYANVGPSVYPQTNPASYGPPQVVGQQTPYYPVPPPSAPHNRSPPHLPSPLPESPVRSPYTPTGPNTYPNPSTLPLPVQPGPIPPPYPVYPPYMYGYGQPYMYWSHPGQAPAQNYPAPPPPPPPPGASSYDSSEVAVPPPSSIARPPPPGESSAVAGYREIAPVSTDGEMPVEERTGRPEQRGGNQGGVIFGSIASKSPSPARLSPVSERKANEIATDKGEGEGEKDGDDKSFTTIAIGVTPGEPVPSHGRSRTRSKGRRRVETTPGRFMSDVTNNINRDSDKDQIKVKVIDLTDSDSKWEFGSTRRPEADEGLLAPPAPGAVPHIHTPQAQVSMGPPPVLGPVPPMPAAIPMGISPLGSPIDAFNGYPMPPPPFAYPNAPMPPGQSASESDEWEVKDYGYGFGHMSGTGYGPSVAREAREAREERFARERVERTTTHDRAGSRDRDRDRDRERDFGRPRRGSATFNSGYGYERGGRRGRGGPAHGGRGYTRGFGRGAYQQQARQAPFTITPPPHLQTLPPLADSISGYYATPQPPTTYIPMPYEIYNPPPVPQTSTSHSAPPLPMPLTPITFPLDSTRYYLLGQLEYYVSPQNMARDFFLRQHMDSLGWIHIPLLASFKRVKQLTMDVQLVKEVFTLSGLVETRDDWVRMARGQWERFILPTAQRSVFANEADAPSAPVEERGPASEIAKDAERESEAKGEAEEESEEEVVFVLGHEVEKSW